MTAQVQTHPPKEQLVAFGLGKLDPPEAARIEEHLEACPDCCATVLELQDDTFVGLVRQCEAAAPPEPSGATLDLPAGASASGIAAAELPAALRSHGRYEILELVGRGGMGDVYKAQHKVMDRPVALKVIKPQLVRHEAAVQRFRREVQAAARLHHRHIVTAHDAEQAGDLHFLVMEFVDGVNLGEVVRQRGPLPVAEACEYIRQAAAGLAHAHELGMVHRDVKPQNLMVARGGEVKILDFGLAGFATEVAEEEVRADAGEALDETAQALAQLTQMGTMMGTPDYIAPEQAKNAHAADIRADIYSLGCTLYFLLAGKPPFAEGDVMQKLQAHRSRMPGPIESVRVDVPAELAEVLGRLLAKDPAQRFQSPAEVADALAPFVERHRSDQRELPADFRPLTLHVQARSTGRVVSWFALNRGELIDASRVPYFFFTVTLPDVITDLIEHCQALDPHCRVETIIPTSSTSTALDLAIVGKGFRIVCARRLTRGWFPLNPFAAESGGNYDVVVTIDTNQPRLRDELVALLTRKYACRMHDHALLPAKAPLPSPGPSRTLVGIAALVAAALFLAAALGVVIYVATDQGTLVIEADDPGVEVTITRPRSDTHKGLTVRIVDRVTGSQVVRLPSGHYRLMLGERGNEFTLTKEQFVLRRGDKVVARVVRRPTATASTGQTKFTEVGRLVGHKNNIDALAYSPDGKFLFDGSGEKLLSQWDVAAGRIVRKIPVGDYPQAIVVHPDGRHVISSQYGGSITMWSLDSGRAVRQFAGHARKVQALAISPDGKRLLSGGQDGLVRLWSVETGEPIRSFQENYCDAVALTADGRLAAHGATGSGLWIWDVETGQKQRQISRAAGAVRSAAFSPDGSVLATGDGYGLIQVWDVKTGKEIHHLDVHQSDVTSLVFVPGGRYFVSGSYDKTMRLFDLATGTEVASVQTQTLCVSHLAIAPDGRTLASGGGKRVQKVDGQWQPVKDGDYDIRLWRLPAGIVQPPPVRLFTISLAGELVRIDVTGLALSSTVVKEMGEELQSAEGLAMADGMLYAAANQASGDSRLYAIDADTGEATLRGSLGVRQVDGLAWRDGKLLGVTSRFDGKSHDGADAGRLLSIDAATGKTQPIGGDLALDDLDSLTFDDRGRLITTDGMERLDQFYELDPQGAAPPKALAPTPPVTTDRDIEGLTLARNGMLYGVTHPGEDEGNVSYLLRIDPRTFQYENLGKLSFGALCLAADLRPRADEPLQITTAERLFTGPDNHGFSIAVSKDGSQALVGLHARGVSLWDVASGKQIRRFEGPERAVHSVHFWPDGKHAVAASEDGTIRLWELESGREVRQFEGHTGRIDCLALSRDGSLLLSGSADYGQERDQSVRLWDTAGGNEVRRCEVASFVRGLVFSRDADRAYGACVGMASVIEWNVASGAVVHRFPGCPTAPISLAVSPNGRLLATGHYVFQRRGNKWNDPDNAVVRLWDLQTRSIVRELRGHAGPVGDVGFTPDGRYLLSTATGEHDSGSTYVETSDQTVRLWEVETGREVARYHMQERVIQLAVLPDGKSFVTVGDSIRLWRLPESVWPAPSRPPHPSGR